MLRHVDPVKTSKLSISVLAVAAVSSNAEIRNIAVKSCVTKVLAVHAEKPSLMNSAAIADVLFCNLHYLAVQGLHHVALHASVLRIAVILRWPTIATETRKTVQNVPS
tara:strand:+ start:9663 stop:9986 length:324 start_codon:yes stop_codon:yes gene_type:complete